MARTVYGSTFWGNYFLEGLNNFYANDARIDRGRRYASGGRVFDYAQQNGKIKAKVRGNWTPYYNVELEFNPLLPKDIEKVYEIIDKNPLILASIINGELPAKLLQELEKEKISLFPRNFNELKRSCSCPDWGDPCKHMAGIYFVTTAMIDNNPFVLLNLRAVDLINHYKIKKEIEIEYPFALKFAKSKPKNEEIDILKFGDFKDFILSKLAKNPPFVSIDFHNVLDDFYKYSKRFLPTIISPKESKYIEQIQRIFQSAEFRIEIDKELNYLFRISHPLLDKELLYRLFEKEDNDFSFIEIVNIFLALTISKGNEAYNYLYHLSRIAYLLFNSCGFVFDIVQCKKSYKAIAKPLLSPLDIQKQLELLEKITPNILYLEDKSLTSSSTNQILLSLIFTDIVQKLNFPMKKGKGDRAYEKIFDMLFHFKSVEKNFEIDDAIKSLDRYFSLFDILNSNIKFSIVITESSNSYKMAFLANDKNIHLIKEQKEKIATYKLIVKFSSSLYDVEKLTKQRWIDVDEQSLEKFILEQKEILQDLGIGVVIPKELQKLLKPKLKIKAKSIGKLQSFLSLDKLLEYNFFLSIGDQEISQEEFENLLKSGKKLVKFKENFVYLDPKEINALFKQMEKGKKLSKFDLLHLSFNDELELDIELKVFIDEIFKPKKYPLPPIKANLREYQKSGFLWAVNNLLNGFGVILADDMGLGKTLQTITIISYMKKQEYLKKPVLVVMPTTLLNNWAKEIEKFAPNLSYSFYYGVDRSIKKSDIIFTTYQIIRRDIESLKKEKFDMIVIDEAQNIKNPTTSIALSVKSIKAKYKIALSGTPVENNLSELWSIFDFAIPKYLKSLKDFQKNYAKEIEINKNKDVANRLKNITSPFMLRRLKTDKSIINDLPQKIVIDEIITMEISQAALYQSFLDEMLEVISSSEPKSRSGMVFKLLVNLKQICNHPKNFDKSLKSDYMLSGKSKRVVELLDAIIQRDEKVLIFTQYTQMGDILEEIIKKELLVEPLYLKGSLSKKRRDELIESFNNDKSKKVFILSLKAGGVGLNLTSANNVIHYDLWFNPAVENQATDRAFRIGQNKNVNVFRFITKSSFEEKIDKMIKAKEELQNLSVSVGENWIGKMSNEELKKLFE